MMSRRQKQKPLVVTLEGEIGAGKSTLNELLCEALVERGVRACVVPEPVDVWKETGALQDFYRPRPAAEQKAVAYAFQTFTFATRVQALRGAAERNPGAEVFLLERSVYTDRHVFMELQREAVGEMYMAMYEEWWGALSGVAPLRPTKAVYLKPRLDRCQTRVEKRARVGEVVAKKDAGSGGGVSVEYQGRLRRAHEAFLQGRGREIFPRMPASPFAPGDVVVVEGELADHDFKTSPENATKTVNFVLDHLGL